MRYLMLLIALAVSACGAEPQGEAASRPPVATEAVSPPEVIPIPKDQEELDRMILAGYTPHNDHLHPPGVESCPLAQGSDSIM